MAITDVLASSINVAKILLRTYPNAHGLGDEDFHAGAGQGSLVVGLCIIMMGQNQP